MNPNQLTPDEILPAAIRLIHRELIPAAAPGQQRALARVARFLAKAHRQLTARLPLPPPLYVGLLPPGDAKELGAWGEQLRRQREESGLSRRQLARLAGVADSTIRNVETGRHRPSRAVVMRLQAVPALGLPAPPGSALTPIPAPIEIERPAKSAATEFSCRCWFAPRYAALELTRELQRQGWEPVQMWCYTDTLHPRLLFVYKKVGQTPESP